MARAINVLTMSWSDDDEMVARAQNKVREQARAAIEEMREPTHAMSREFFIAWTMAERRGFDFPESPVVYAWNRMIDAMLDDGTSAALGEGE